MRFESLLVFILFKFKKRPNISGIRVVQLKQEYYEILLQCKIMIVFLDIFKYIIYSRYGKAEFSAVNTPVFSVI